MRFPGILKMKELRKRGPDPLDSPLDPRLQTYTFYTMLLQWWLVLFLNEYLPSIRFYRHAAWRRSQNAGYDVHGYILVAAHLRGRWSEPQKHLIRLYLVCWLSPRFSGFFFSSSMTPTKLFSDVLARRRDARLLSNFLLLDAVDVENDPEVLCFDLFCPISWQIDYWFFW